LASWLPPNPERSGGCPPGHAGVPYTSLIYAVCARCSNERFEQALAAEKALGLRKRTRQVLVISVEATEKSVSAEMEDIHGIEAHPGVRR
jgi:hypothetical protein